MSTLLFVSLSVALYVSCYADDLIVGTMSNSQLVWQHRAEYNAFPFGKRVKEIVYADPELQIIKAIIVRDVERTKASATLTSGGVGTSFCSIHLKSEHGRRLNYQIEIYV